MTLDRLLSRFGVASRTAAGEAIQAGRVRVNGRIERDPACWVSPERDRVQFDGARLRPERRVYLVFYKPKGVIVSHGDPGGRVTVYDYLEARERERGENRAGREAGSGPPRPWLAPVGRLDKDTSGLLLLTNDTAFAHHVSSPESGVAKTYRVKLNGLMAEETLQRLRGGVQMKRGDEARPVAVRRLEDRGKYTWLEVVLTEGKNREVRRMMEAVGFKVLKLVRTAIGPITLAGLEVGGTRPVAPAELAALRHVRPRPQGHGTRPGRARTGARIL